MPGYDTNLAAEFYALSMLHRMGAEATLTLGNKKGVDIVVVRGKGNAATIDVKGLAGLSSWPVDNLGKPKSDHFIVFVCFRGKIASPHVLPEVWVLPSAKVPALTYQAPKSGRRVVPRYVLNAKAKAYQDAWHLVT